MLDFLHVDTSDIRALGVTHQHRADDLAAVATDLAAAQLPSDAFGPVGAAFLTALNEALRQAARRAEHLAECMMAATTTTRSTAMTYDATETRSEQAISALRA